MSINRPTAWLVCLFFVALTLRCVVLYQLVDSPFTINLIIDAAKYALDASNVLTGQDSEFLTRPFWQAPGYTFFLMGAYRIFGLGNNLAVRLVQADIDSCSCLVLVSLALALGATWPVALAAGFLLAVYAPQIFFVNEMAIPVPFVFLTLVALRLVLLGTASRRTGHVLAAGLVLGAAGIFRPNVFVLALPCLAWMVREVRPAGRPELLRVTGLFVVGIGLAVAPVTLHNYRTGGEFILVSHNGGVNLFVGNNPDWKKTFNSRPGPAWEHIVMLPESERRAAIGPSAGGASGMMVGRVAAYAWQRPGDFLRGMVDKTLLFVHHRELRRNTDIEYCWAYSPLLRLGVLPTFGLLGPFALLGMVFVGRRGAWWFPLSCSVLYAASIIVFFVCGRYRLPVIPFACLFAVLGVVDMVEHRRDAVALGRRVAVLVLCFVLVGGDFVTGIDWSHAETFTYLGNWAQRAGNVQRAREFYMQAVTENPEAPEPHLTLGRYLLASGQVDGAIEQYRRAVELTPDNVLYRRELGGALARAGRHDEAEAEFRKVLAEHPGNAPALEGLAASFVARARYGDAEAVYSRMAAAGMDRQPSVRLEKARAHILQHKTGEAIAELQAVLVDDPFNYDARRNLAYLFLEQKHYDLCVAQLEVMRSRSAKEEGERRYLLGVCALSRGRLDEAKAWLVEAGKVGYVGDGRLRERLDLPPMVDQSDGR